MQFSTRSEYDLRTALISIGLLSALP